MGLFSPDIKKFDKDNNINELARCLDYKKASIRYRAFSVLSARENLPADIINRLKSLVHDPDNMVKTVATLRFAGTGDKSVSGSVMDIMRKGSAQEKLGLLHVIEGMGKTSDETIIEAVMSGLIDRNETVRLQAARAAGSSGSTHLVPNLGEKLHAKHHKERLAAAKALFDIGGDESIDYLIGLLADNHPEVCSAARIYLEKADNEYVRKALNDASFMQLIRDMNAKEPVREKTALYIGAERIREGLPLLHRACRDKYKGVRIQALKSMALFREPGSIDIADRCLHDKFRDVRLEALNVLEKIGGTKAMKAAESALEDKSIEVRKKAGLMLGIKINKPAE